ncbi:MAG: glucosamine-6-phosphate deaminase [Candidatus Aminicenantes bacterium]|nr:glucosamine-6-phosphate deaminase [Candidatus Aminicenantes bacterium]
MEIIILPSYEQVSHEVSARIVSAVQKKPDIVLGLATGNTMLGIYEKVVQAYQLGKVNFKKVKSFNLDEYIGFDPEESITFHSYMNHHLFSHINIPAQNTHIPPSRPTNIDLACREYEHKIKKSGGIDLQLLGIGREGHIGFNEPSSSLQARTRVKTLTETTLKDNFGPKKGARFAITMGIGTIMDSREVILVASGEEKAVAISRAVEGPISSSCPASILQFHKQAKIIIDEKAAVFLSKKDYYKWVWNHKNEVNDVIKDNQNKS